MGLTLNEEEEEEEEEGLAGLTSFTLFGCVTVIHSRL